MSNQKFSKSLLRLEVTVRVRVRIYLGIQAVSLRFGAGEHLDLAPEWVKFMQSLKKFKEAIVAEMLKAARQSRHHSLSQFPQCPALNKTHGYIW